MFPASLIKIFHTFPMFPIFIWQQLGINKLRNTPQMQKWKWKEICVSGAGEGAACVILFINRTQIRRIQKSQKKRETKMNVDCRLFLPSFGPVSGRGKEEVVVHAKSIRQNDDGQTKLKTIRI